MSNSLQAEFPNHLIESTKFSVIANNINNAVVITDAHGKIEWVNDGFVKMSGYDLTDVEGKKPGSFLQGKESDPNDTLAIREKIRSHLPFEHTILNYTKDKKKYWIKMHISPIFDDNGLVVNFVSVQSDITKDKISERKLKDALKEAREAQKRLRDTLEEKEEISRDLMLSELKFKSKFKQEGFMSDSLNKTKNLLEHTRGELKNKEKLATLGVMLAGVAHEINNPMGFISNGTDALKQSTTDLIDMLVEFDNLIASLDRDTQQKFEEIKDDFGVEDVIEEIPNLVDDIKLGVRRTTEIANGLRVFSRQDSEKKVEADVHQLIESSLSILRGEYKHRVKIQTDFDQSLTTIQCYPGPLSQVLVNLIKNAIQAIPEDRKDGLIKITTSQHKDQIAISIEDNGTGIPEDIQSRIFQPFYTTKAVGVGTGLGMSISREIIVDGHKGKIDFKSTLNKGTVFELLLPVS